MYYKKIYLVQKFAQKRTLSPKEPLKMVKHGSGSIVLYNCYVSVQTGALSSWRESWKTKIRVFKWPSQTSDLNTVTNVWSDLIWTYLLEMRL